MPLINPSKQPVPSAEVPSASLKLTQKSEIYEKQVNSFSQKDSLDPDIKYRPQFPANTQAFKEFPTLPTLSQSKINFPGINCWLASPSGLVDANDLQFLKLQIGGTTGRKL